MTSFKPGDRVMVAWGLDAVAGTVLSLFGTAGEQFARIELELPSDEEFPVLEAVTLPVDLLERASAA
jgi:hypothetical protein